LLSIALAKVYANSAAIALCGSGTYRGWREWKPATLQLMPMREDAERDQHHLRNRSEDVVKDPVRLVADLKDDGLIGFERIERSNGGLFDGDRALPNEEGSSGCQEGS
jgi:hypothetical protein